jgi:bifunctional UDP-N-acetylglucosamine pyrophosphorylase/glucosamine-1-phosphate N-acetyltransferase
LLLGIRYGSAYIFLKNIFKMINHLSVIILAAGKGTRMRSGLPKVMHKVANREILHMVIDTSELLKPADITIVIPQELRNFQEKILQQHSQTKISFAVQKEPKGTADAVLTAIKKIRPKEINQKKIIPGKINPKEMGRQKTGNATGNCTEKMLILYGDTPLVSCATLQKMLNKIDDFSLCILGFEEKKENMYGRLVVDSKGHLEKVTEFKDATAAEKKITLCNSGVIAVDGGQIRNLLDKVTNNNAAGEFYLTDIITIAKRQGLKCTFLQTNRKEVLGINSRAELAAIETITQRQLRKKMMACGVTLLDPSSVYFSFDTIIANDVTIHPQVFFGPKVKIEKNVEIRSFCHIEGAEIECGSVIGPFARIRPETQIAQNVNVGNFVEIKKSRIRQDAKISHLSYIGDCEIGQKSNIGAGTITCNYDGYNKFETIIGKNVFVGSNSALIAPVNIEDGAVIGAGSVITKNVAKNELAFSRARQISLPKGGKKFHQKNSSKKK